jgi:hypothetical protein
MPQKHQTCSNTITLAATCADDETVQHLADKTDVPPTHPLRSSQKHAKPDKLWGLSHMIIQSKGCWAAAAATVHRSGRSQVTVGMVGSGKVRQWDGTHARTRSTCTMRHDAVEMHTQSKYKQHGHSQPPAALAAAQAAPKWRLTCSPTMLLLLLL